MGPRRRFPLGIFVVVFVLALAVFLTHSLWMAALGSALVNEQGPAKADIAVVLGGDYWGHRILKAAELARQQYVPAVLVSGPPGFYGYRESDLAIQFAVRHGYPAQYFINFPVDALNTRDEAAAVLAELRRRNVHSFLLVTSTFHSARATRVYQRLERGQQDAPTFRTVAAEDQFFRPRSWWENREGEKAFFNEWMKTVANFLGI